jgi:acetyl/propionyl-CoA carboxylase alpha subunit/acetyl-CoA carboxylase carboxyltransferase component
MRAVRELNAEFGCRITTIAFHTDAERRAMFVRQADESVSLGPASRGIELLEHAELRRALLDSGANALWVGWGHGADDIALAELCLRLNLTFIGPPLAAMRTLRDTLEVRRLAEAVGVQLVPRSRQEAVTDLRHVEVQILADGHGNVWPLDVRVRPIRGHQVIEESGPPPLTDAQTDHIRGVSAELVRAAGYRSAGTIEYLYQPDREAFEFLGVDTRLHAGHPITEMTRGLDLVKLQILVAAGAALEADCPIQVGHAVQARLDAQLDDKGFGAAAPGAGTVQLLKFPLGPGVRVDTGFAEGDVLSPDLDSTMARIIAWGRNRREALARLRTALRDTTVVIKGGTTNKSFLLDLLALEYGAGDAAAGTRAVPTAEIALVAAAINAYNAEERGECAAFLASAHGGRPRASHTIGRSVKLGYADQRYQLTVMQVGPHRYRIAADNDELVAPVVDLEPFGEFESCVILGGQRFGVVTQADPVGLLVEVDGVSHRIDSDQASIVRATAPSVVVALPVTPGDVVEAGDTLVVLECMKMETAVRAASGGRVREVFATLNDQVDAGAALLSIEQAGEGSNAHAAGRVRLRAGRGSEEPGPGHQALARLGELRSLIIGYDVGVERARILLAEYESLRDGACCDDQLSAELLEAELGLLGAFDDICELSRDRPTFDEEGLDEAVHSPREFFHRFLHSLDADLEGLPPRFRAKLIRALRHYDITTLERGPALGEAVYRLFLALQRMENQVPVVAALLKRWLRADHAASAATVAMGEMLERLIATTQLRYPVIGDLARDLQFKRFDEPQIMRARAAIYQHVRRDLQYLGDNPDAADYASRIDALVATPHLLIDLLAERMPCPGTLLEVVTRQHYEICFLEDVDSFQHPDGQWVTGRYEMDGRQRYLLSAATDRDRFSATLNRVETASIPAGLDAESCVVDIYLAWPDAPVDGDALSLALRTELAAHPGVAKCGRVTVTMLGRGLGQFTFRRDDDGAMTEEPVIRDMHPLLVHRFDLWRLKNFDATRLPAAAGTYLFKVAAKENRSDERLVALAEVRDVTPHLDKAGAVTGVPAIERTLTACLDGIRRARGGNKRLDHNRVALYLWPVLDISAGWVSAMAQPIAPLTIDAGLEEVTILATVRDEQMVAPRRVAIRFSYRPGAGMVAKVTAPPTEPLRPLDEYTKNVRRCQARGLVYPYELLGFLTGGDGTFVEYDFDAAGELVPVQRPYGRNTAGLIVGTVSRPTERYPEGMTRVVLFGDPTKALGTVAEAECARVVAALDLAQRLSVPVEWFALSSGATISMDSGTENMDWISRALRRIIEFTQNGGEINVVVAGINVGAQPYWNAEATMLMHTKGILVMTPDSAMVLTGKRSLDYSGGVSAEDNFGIGGYDRVMGPNGQAQYWAPNLQAACDVLFAHYEHAYVAPGERFPRRATTSDPTNRDVRPYPHEHPSSELMTVGDIFSETANKDRKKPFDIRAVMRAVVDQDHPVLERWADMADADTAVVCDAHIAGIPVCVLGIESRAIPRKGWRPSDGPDQWTSGTLFPQSSRKTARAINATSGNRPLVVLTNLSGFDGSPESLRRLQLEYGAEIGRAVVNFNGPIVFVVISRFHGGAFVVFSNVLNDNMEVLAVDGSFASVIGGAPAAAVVFARDVDARTEADPAVRELKEQLAGCPDGAARADIQLKLAETRAVVRSAKHGEVAAEYEAVHNIERASRIGSVHTVIPAAELRPRIADSLERGMARTIAALKAELNAETAHTPKPAPPGRQGFSAPPSTTIAQLPASTPAPANTPV